MSHHVADDESEADGERPKDASEEMEPSKSTTDDSQGVVGEATAPPQPKPAKNHVVSNNSSSSSGDPAKSTSPSNSHNTNHATSEPAPFSQVFALLGDTPGAELTRPELRCRQYGATAKGKTQDDQNVGKRQKKKKVSSKFSKISVFFMFFFS